MALNVRKVVWLVNLICVENMAFENQIIIALCAQLPYR